jgi:D-glycero-alpha-D-manno-heptose-7-phosphate kinase
MTEVFSRAPTRIDLGGGWTDVPPYCEREGGFVCNLAITRYATTRITDTLDSVADSTDEPLIRAALRRSGANGLRVFLRSDFPIAAGLGGSSAASAAVLGALCEWRGQTMARDEIAEEGRRIEVEEMGIAGGRQDHYAATHGGALALTFTDMVSVRRIPLAADCRDELRARSTLIYTGASRISGDTISAVLGAYEAGEQRVVRALSRMRELAREMADSLERGDVDGIGELLSAHWGHQRALHPSISTARIDEIVARSRKAGALGAKAMGASGGGCVYIVARTGQTSRVRESIRTLGQILDFDFDDDGLVVSRSEF